MLKLSAVVLSVVAVLMQAAQAEAAKVRPQPLKGNGYYVRAELDAFETLAGRGVLRLQPEHAILMSDGSYCLGYSEFDRWIWCSDVGRYFVPRPLKD